MALSTLLTDDGCAARAAAAGAAPRLLDALQRHGDDAEATFQTLTAVGNYCGSDRERCGDVGAAGVELAVRALTAHAGGHTGVAARAAHALLRLSYSRRPGGALPALAAAAPALAAAAAALPQDPRSPASLARTLLERLLGRLERGPCAHCGELGEPRALKRCSRCRAARYCSVACAAAAWPTHKAACVAPAAPAAAGSSADTPAAGEA
jgi:hypothetical protein